MKKTMTKPCAVGVGLTGAQPPVKKKLEHIHIHKHNDLPIYEF